MNSVRLSALVLMLAVMQFAAAITFPVTNTNADGAGSLRQAIVAANANNVDPVDDIVFDNNLTGTITPVDGVSDFPVISGDLRIFGPTEGMVTIDLSSDDHIVIGSSDTSVEFHDLRIINGSAVVGGCLQNNGGATLLLNRITFSGCFASAEDSNGAKGGALYTTGPTTIMDSRFELNIVSGFNQGSALGGAVAVESNNSNPSLLITGSTFAENIVITDVNDGFLVSRGGAVFQRSGILEVSNSWFSLNQATHSGTGLKTASGGAIRYQGTALMVRNSVFSRNIVQGAGGAISIPGVFMGPIADVRLENNQFMDHFGNQGDAFTDGAAVAISNADLRMRNNTFFGNNSVSGASDFLHGSALDNVSISGNVFALSGDGSPSCGVVNGTSPDPNFTGDFNFFSDATCSWMAAAGSQHVNLNLQTVGLTTSSARRPVVLPLSNSVLLDAAAMTTSPTNYSVCPIDDLSGLLRPIDNDSDGNARCSAGALEAALIFADGLE